MKEETVGKRKDKLRMTLAQKLTVSVLLVLTLALSLGGTAVLQGNFSDALEEAARQAENQHLLHCYVIESDLLDVTARGETVTDAYFEHYGSALAQYAGGSSAAIYRIAGEPQETETGSLVLQPVYSSFSWDETPSGDTDTYRIRRSKGNTWLLLETQLRTPDAPPMLLMTAHDVTRVYAARDRALLRFWEMELVVLLCAGAIAALMLRRMIKPLARLTQASRSIAAGAYDERTGLESGDEIGALSRSFDAMAQAVQEKVDALKLSVQQREDFMAAFTHELKTPMTAVIGYSDTLRSMQCSPEQQRMAADYIFSEARRVETLSENLLQLLGLRDAPPQLHPALLNEIFERTKKAVTPVIAPVVPVFDDAGGLAVLAEQELLVDLLYNLILNAKNAKPKDGRVVIGFRKTPDGGADVFVRDTGCGIPEKALSRVTEPFYMVDKSRARAGGGSGMGLALCRRIADLHSSQLWIESKEGEGTTVTVHLAAPEKKGDAPHE